MRCIWLPFVLMLSGCVATVEQPAPRPGPEQGAAPVPAAAARPSAAQQRQFAAVVSRMEPVAERECERRAPRLNCDFKIVVDDRPNRPPNAFQTQDRSGRPILAFNLALIASVRNTDELAFVMGHEAAHHVSGHLARQQQNATAGAIILGGLAAMTGATEASVRAATDLGAAVGARSYSKDYELEADALGTVITHRAGFDPVRGAQFFNRIPDPGNRFLGTHPPNAARMETVRRVASQL